MSSLLQNIMRERTLANSGVFNVVSKIIANNGEKKKLLEVFVFFFLTEFMEDGEKPCMLPKIF